MTAHTHTQHVEGCYRCELGRDEETGLTNTTDREYEAFLIGHARGISEPSDLFEPPGLRALVEQVTYKPGWVVSLIDATEDDGSGGLALRIISDTEDSLKRDQRIRVRHHFLVPPATYNRDTWAAWIFDRFRDVESHEAGEFFCIDGLREFAPHHSNGEDPYRVWHVGDWVTANKRSGDD